jgi:hypothetical protein
VALAVQAHFRHQEWAFAGEILQAGEIGGERALGLR